MRADLKKSTGAPDQLWWYVTRDRRRKAGTLVANVRLEGVLPAHHPMAWLEPRNWTSGQGARGASAQWTSADIAAAAKAWADTYGRREDVAQIQPTRIPQQTVETTMRAATVLRHERFERAPAQPHKRRRGPLPRGVVSIQGRRVNLRVGDRAELVGYTTTYAEDNGKRVRIVDVDVGRGWVGVRSLDGVLRCDDGTTTELDVRSTNLRRVWAGLSEDERIKLRLWRGAP